MDTVQPDQPTTKINRLTRRSRLVLILTLAIAAFMRLPLITRPILIVVLISNLIALGLIWYIVNRRLNFTAALIFGLMYVLSPWQILYSRLGLFYDIFANALAQKPNPFLFTTWTATGLGIEHVLSPASSINLIASVPRPAEVWLLLIGGAVLLGFPALWFRSRQIFIVVALWVIIPILVASFTDYLMPAIFPLCILAGAGVAWLIKLMPGKPYSRMIILAAYGVVFLSQALWWRGALRYLELMAR